MLASQWANLFRVAFGARAFRGMNLFAHAALAATYQFRIFVIVRVPTTVLSLYTVDKSRRLAYLLDVLASEKLGWSMQLRALVATWDSRHELPVD